MSEPCGPHRVRRPLRAATLRGGCPFFAADGRGANGAFGRCDVWPASDSDVRSDVHFGLYSGLRSGLHWPAFQSAFRVHSSARSGPASGVHVKPPTGLVMTEASRRGPGEVHLRRCPPPSQKKTASRRGSGLVRLSDGGGGLYPACCRTGSVIGPCRPAALGRAAWQAVWPQGGPNRSARLRAMRRRC